MILIEEVVKPKELGSDHLIFDGKSWQNVIVVSHGIYETKDSEISISLSDGTKITKNISDDVKAFKVLDYNKSTNYYHVPLGPK